MPTTKEVKNNIAYNDPKIKTHTWGEVKSELIAAITKIEVRSVHGLKKTSVIEYHRIEEIDYEAHKNIGLSVIAVGGNKLARGITLEGLSISYYLRTTRMYDSLMQMGRWFGYRPGYADLCRLYTTSQLINWYRHVTMATEEMRNDFDEMAANNMVPKDYQLKVRTHPGMLMVTSLTKMREHEKIQVGFSGKLIQTYSFNKADVNSNYNVFKYLLSRLNTTPQKIKTGQKKVNALLWNKVDSVKILDFISSFKTPIHRLDIMKSYIEKQNNEGLLQKWSLAVWVNSRNDSKKEKWKWSGGDFEAGLPTRSLIGDETKQLSVKGSKNAILGKEHRMVDLGLKIGEKPSEDDLKEIRKRLQQPLIVILPIDSYDYSGIENNLPIIGLGIIFPIIESEKKFEYAARPLNPDFEEEPQQSDDKTDDE